jgi:Fic family protein
MTFERIDELKRRLDALRPLPPAIAARLREHCLVEWTHHSTALEGNTLSLVETRVVLLDGLTVGGKTLREHLEIVDHRDAVEYLEACVREALPLTEAFVREVHRLVLKGTWPEEAGRYRRSGVVIAGSRHAPPPPALVSALVRDLVEEHNRSQAHPVEKAAVLHWRLAYVHPFADGNGRTARLLMNFSLMRDGYPPAVIRKEWRKEYLEALEEASVNGNLGPFVGLVAEAAAESLELWLRTAGGA